MIFIRLFSIRAVLMSALLTTFSMGSAVEVRAAAPVIDQVSSLETAAAKDARLGWWREARFGMFIHWGVYSALAGEW